MTAEDGSLVSSPAVTVVNTSTTGSSFLSAGVDSSTGQYDSFRLVPGAYKLVFESLSETADATVDELYDEIACPQQFCELESLGQEVQVIDADVQVNEKLSTGYRIEGQLTDSAGAPVADDLVRIEVFDDTGRLVSRTRNLGGNGQYATSALPDGTYYVKFSNRFTDTPFVNEVYNDVQCVFGCDPTAVGTPIPIGGAHETGIDAQLSPGFEISGSVTDAANNPVPDDTVFADVFDAATGGFITSTRVISGEYSVAGLPDGDYKVRFSSSQFVDEIYDGVICQACDLTANGAVITVNGSDRAGINASLDTGATIQGQVLSEIDNSPIEGNVQVLQVTADSIRFVERVDIDSSGNYSIGGLAAGNYKVWFDAAGADDRFIDELFDDVNCPQLRCDERSLGTTIMLTSGETEPVSSRLTPGAELNGTITASDGATLTEVDAQLFDQFGNFVSATRIESGGRYTLRGIVPGDYKLRFVAFGQDDAYIDQLHEDIQCVDFCDVTDGKSVSLQGGQATTIDATLQRGLVIQGRISDEDDPTAPVVEGWVEVYTDQGDFQRSFFFNDADGQYSTGGLLPGDYKIKFDPTGEWERYLPELHQNIACPGFCDVSALGTVVTLVDQDVQIDASLTRGQLISGRVLDDAGNPFASSDVSVQVQRFNGSSVRSDRIAFDSGEFQVGVPAGEYRVFINAFGNLESWIDQYHDGTLCGPLGFCETSTVPSIDATSGDVELGDISLTLGGELAVRVQANTADPRPPVANGTVWIQPDDDVGVTFARGLNMAGEEILSGVVPGDYFVGVDSRQSSPLLIDEIFDDIPWPTRDFRELPNGTPLTVTAGGVSEAAFVLDPVPIRTASGTVVDATTGALLGDVKVNSPQTGDSITTGADGSFTLDFPERTNLVFERDAYLTRVLAPNFEGGSVICPLGSCFEATSTTTTADADVSGVQIEMQPGARAAGALALPDGSPLPASRAFVRVFDESGVEQFDFNLRSSAEGAYQVELPPGRWHLLVEGDFLNAGLVHTALGQTACPEGSCGMETTTAVEVAQGDAVADQDVQLLQGVPLAGSLLDGDTTPAAPLEGFFGVTFYDSDGDWAGTGFTNQDGSFVTRFGVPPGTYFASTYRQDRRFSFSRIPTEFADELYDDIPCLGGCDVTSGTPVVVGDTDTSPSLVNIEVNRGLSITGQVAQGGASLPGVLVQAFDSAGDVSGFGVTDDAGAYEIQGLLPGNYFVGTDNSAGLGDEVYDNVACEPFCNPTVGDSVQLLAGDPAPSINFDLVGLKTLAGRVVDDADAALSGQTVEIYNAVGSQVASDATDELGDWQVDGLSAGQYFVRTRNSLGLVDKAFPNADCNGCVITATEPVDLTMVQERTDLRFALETGGAIMGTVTSASDGPIGSVGIRVYDASGELAASTQSATDGTFLIEGLGAPSDYFVTTSSSIGFVDELNPDIVCEPTCTPTDGTAVSVAAGATETVDFELGEAGRISGTVTNRFGSPLASVRVQAFTSEASLIREATTGASGTYELSGIPPGEAFLQTAAASGFTDQVWQGFDCSPICDVVNGSAVTVTPGALSSDVDFALTEGSGIAGTVESTAGDLLSALDIEVFNNLGQPVATTTTDVGGNYSAEGLADGRYFVRTRNNRSLVDEVFDNVTCTPGPCVPGTGDAVDLAGGIVSDIDFALEPGSSFDGTATDQFNNPLPFGEVVLFDQSGREVKRADILDGEWTLSGVAQGSYHLVVQNGSRLIDELFADLPCPRSRCNVTEGQLLVVGAAPATVQSSGSRGSVKATVSVEDGPINVALESGSLIRGRVTGPDGGIAGAEVTFFNDQGEVVGSATANGAGHYESASAFNAGTYFAATSDGEQRGVGDGLVNALYEGASCALECDPTTGMPIELDAQSDVEGIDFAIAEGGAIRGLAVDDLANPLPGATIEVFDEQGRLAGTTTVNSLGNWKVDGLPDGEYTVVLRTDLFSEFTDFVIGAGRCNGDCDPTAGATFTVSAGSEGDVDPIELIPEAIIFRSDFE